MENSSFFGTFMFVIVVTIILSIFNQVGFVKNYILAVVIFFAFEMIIKVLHKKIRPDYKTKKPISWYDEFEEKHSFPSGHSGKIALFTTLIHLNYGSLYFTGLFIILSLLVGASRMSLQRHYLKDVIGGYVLGIIFALII